jgi:hypothetical protein
MSNFWHFFPDLLLRNALKDPQGFQEFLINQTGISPQVVQQLLNAKLNSQQVLIIFK